MPHQTSNDYEKVPCPVCGTEKFSDISDEIRFAGKSRVVICPRCGLVQLNPRWKAPKYQEYYENQYHKDYPDKTTGRFQKIKIIVFRLRQKGFLKKQPQKILEIGAATGDSLEYLRKKLFPYAEYFAIEPSIACQKQLKQKQIELVANSVKEIHTEKYNQEFDLIIMRHVAEHFLQPVSDIKKIARLLNPKGIFYIAVPNALNPTHPIKNNHFRNVHTYYYNRHTLGNILKMSGLKIAKAIEGDTFLISELAVFAQKASTTEKPVFDKKMAEKQEKIYKTRLKNESNFTTKLFYFFRQRMAKYLAFLRLSLDSFRKSKG